MIKGFQKNPFVHIILILLLCILAYSNTFQSSFHFDDEFAIIKNPAIKDFGFFYKSSKAKAALSSYEYESLRQRYVGFLTFALNYRLHGLDVTGYHVFNIIIHVINGLLVYWLVLLILKDTNFSKHPMSNSPVAGSYNTIFALFLSLLFVLHPIQTQAITYLVQRFASLATMFYLLAIVMYIKARFLHESSGKALKIMGVKFTLISVLYFVTSIICTVAAMKTKEIAFTLPFIIVLIDFLFIKGSRRVRTLFLIPIILTLLIIPLSLMSSDRPISEALIDVGEVTRAQTSMPRWQYLITEFRVLVTYIRLIFLPVNQNLDYDYPLYQSFFDPEVFFSFLLLVLLFITGVFLLHRFRHSGVYVRIVSFGIFWFFITLSVESSIVPILDVIYEHRMYLPSIGVFMAIIASLFVLAEKLKEKWNNIHKYVLMISVIIITMLTGATYARNSIWKDEESLWRDVVKKSPMKARGYNNLGLALYEKGKLDDALVQYQKSLSIEPSDAEVYSNIGIVYLKKGLIKEAVSHLKYAVSINPLYPTAHYNLGLAYGRLGLRNLAYEEMKKGYDLGYK